MFVFIIRLLRGAKASPILKSGAEKDEGDLSVLLQDDSRFAKKDAKLRRWAPNVVAHLLIQKSVMSVTKKHRLFHSVQVSFQKSCTEVVNCNQYYSPYECLTLPLY